MNTPKNSAPPRLSGRRDLKTPETFFEKFDLFADTPNAVAKMRELVLELAVQGKLVEQSANDESAAKVLERAKTYANNSMRWEHTLKAMSARLQGDSSAPGKLPAGWVWACNALLGDVSPRNEVRDNTQVAFAPMNLIPTDYRTKPAFRVRPWGEIKKGYTHFANGDIAVAKITPCFQNGKACVMSDLSGGIGAGTTELHVLRPYPKTVIPLYLLMFFKSPEFVKGGVATFTGTAGQQRVSNEYFKFCPVPLPPLAEQKRIVAKVDELMALCDRLEAQQQERDTRHATLARASLARFADAPTPANLNLLFHKSYDIAPADLRKSILTLAVQGKLVPQNPNDEPAFIPVDGLFNGAFEVPENWAWINLEDLEPEFQNGASSRGDKGGTPIIVIRLADVESRRISLEDPRSIAISIDQVAKYRLQMGDTLITRVNGSADIVGTFIPVQDSLDAIYCDHFIRMRINSDRVFPAYTALVGDSQVVREQIRSLFITTAGQKTVNQGHIRSLCIPLPPLAEQRRIVAKVDELMALVDALETQLTASRATATNLLDAVVAELTSVN